MLYININQPQAYMCPPNPETPPKAVPTHLSRLLQSTGFGCPLLPSSPFAFHLSQHQDLFSNESVLYIRWPKCWSFSFSISPSNEYSGVISFRMDWLHLFAIQGTLKSLLQPHSSKVSIVWCSAFFIAQLSHPYMTTGETIALTR